MKDWTSKILGGFKTINVNSTNSARSGEIVVKTPVKMTGVYAQGDVTVPRTYKSAHQAQYDEWAAGKYSFPVRDYAQVSPEEQAKYLKELSESPIDDVDKLSDAKAKSEAFLEV